MRATSSPPGGENGNLSRKWKMAEGAYVRHLRKKLGMTQLEVAKELGLPDSKMVSFVEVGQNHIPADRIEDFARVLKVPAKDFSKRILRFQHPWIYKLQFGADAELQQELDSISPNN